MATTRDLGQLDLAPMRGQLQGRLDTIKQEMQALQAEQTELERVLGSMPQSNGSASPSSSSAGRSRSAGSRSTSSRSRSTAKRAPARSRSGSGSGRSRAKQAVAAASQTSAASETPASTEGSETAPKAATPRRRRSSGKRSTSSRSRSAKAAGGRPVGEMTDRLVALLQEGPKARQDIAKALDVSASRVQQLLAGLGNRVADERDADNPRRKLWRLTDAGTPATA